MDHAIINAFISWADAVLTEHPEEAVAYNFNLYEHENAFAIQLIGAERFDAEDTGWACDEMFTSGEDLFELPHAVVGEQWEAALKGARTLVQAYLRTGAHSARLGRARAVALGFVDGDIEVVAPAAV